MASLNLKTDYGIELLSYYLWGQSTPPSDLARKDNYVLIPKDYSVRDEKASLTIQALAFDYMKYVDRYTNATNFGVFQKFFEKVFSEKELEKFKDKIENEMYVLGLDEIVKTKIYRNINPFINENENKVDRKYNENKMAVKVIHYYLNTNSIDYAKRSFAFGNTRIAFNEDVKFHIDAKTYKPLYISNLKLYPLDDNFDFESDDLLASIINPFLKYNLDPLKIGRKVNIKFIDKEKIEPIVINKNAFEILKNQSFSSLTPSLDLFYKYYKNHILPSKVLYLQDDTPKTHANNTTIFTHNNSTKFNQSTSHSPNFITLHLKDEQDKVINYAKVIIKGFKYNEALETINLKRKSDGQGRIRFDQEKYFKTCYSFKIKLDEKEAYCPTPLQNAKRIFNNYNHHKEGLVLKFRAKDHLVYDGFNVYHYKGNDLINTYMARSGTAKASNEKRSDKQIASCFYQGKKAYFYYDDESIKDKFGTLAEGQYYFKINEITKDTQPHFLKNYPFEMGRTWGKYCVRLYSDKECLQTKNQTKDHLYLYSINDKGEFGSSGSIGMAQAELLENLSQQTKWIHDEKDGIVSLRVKYPKKLNHKIVFANNTIDLNTSFAPGTYIGLKLEKENNEILKWAYVECECKEKLDLFFQNPNEVINERSLKFLFQNKNLIHNESYKKNILSFSLPMNRTNEPKEEMQDYKYYIIVFAYQKEKNMPSLEDPYIVIDMSFRVGVGSDENVREGTLTNLRKNIMQNDYISSVLQALDFLKASQGLKEKINEENNYKFFIAYPQLAGKIAYIYYRFDLASDEFIKSVYDGNEYLRERERFYTIASEIYLKNSNYKMAFEKRLQNEMINIEMIKDFLKNFAKELKIEEGKLPVIGYQPQDGDSGTYNHKDNTFNLNPNASNIDLLDTIIHEFRHFYVYHTRNNPQNSINKLLHSNMLEFYVVWNFSRIFNHYDKQCLIYDSVEYGTAKCYLNKTYYESRKGGNKNINEIESPLYFIQPLEREAKIIAGKFREKIGANNAYF